MTAPTLHEWFARSARRWPDAVALEIGDRAWAYDELLRCAAGVAERIVREHGRPPGRVALLANQSLVAFAGYLAAQRLGAAVVPLNPGFPLPRNRLVVELASCDVLLADESGLPQLAEGLGEGVPTVLGLSEDEVPARDSGVCPARPAGPDDVAYVLFTSGSTGRPKGVPIRHRNVSPYIAHNIARFAVGPGARTSHMFDLTFDPSVHDLFVTWGAGATLVCPERPDLLAPVRYLLDRRITHWFSVPSVVSVGADLDTLPTGLATDVRHSVFIGEQLTYRQARLWRAVAPRSLIDNVYGPTELTVACTEYRLPADAQAWPETSNDTVPIGEVYDFLDHVVLDEHGRESTDGELCVRGAQRFDGYLDPADSPGRFVAADGTQPDAVDARCYYRTGDQVRREGGHLVHLGRLDHQVKIRGYRVELGEIETAVARHPDITEAVVVAVRVGEDVRLHACCVGAPVPQRQLVRWLRARLPLHMVPRGFHHLDAMPLNPNGKIDRRALHDMVLARTASPPAESIAGR